jgi:hypothetical protein
MSGYGMRSPLARQRKASSESVDRFRYELIAGKSDGAKEEPDLNPVLNTEEGGLLMAAAQAATREWQTAGLLQTLEIAAEQTNRLELRMRLQH